MNLDQQTIEKSKTQEELKDQIAQLEADLAGYSEKKKEQEAEFGQAAVDINQYVADLKEIIIEKKSQLDGFANKPEVSTAEKIIEEKQKSDLESGEGFSTHRNIIKRAEEMKNLYTNKISEAQESLKTLTPGTDEYIINENLLSQYERELKASQLSIDSNKKELDRLEKTA